MDRIQGTVAARSGFTRRITRAGSLLYWCAALLAASTANAGLLRLESDTLNSVRNDEDQKTEAPLYEFLEASYGTTNRDFEANTAFSYFVDPQRSGTSKFNLFALDASYRLIPRVFKLRFGRSFNIESSIRTVLVDQVAGDLTLFHDLVRMGAFFGYERSREFDTFKKRAEIGGAYLSLRTSSATPLVLNFKYQSRRYTEALERPRETLVQGALTKSFEGAWAPAVVANTEFNIGDYHNRLAEGGFDLNPGPLGLRVRGTTYDLRADEGVDLPPIFAIFAHGRIYEGMLQLDYRLSPTFTAGLAWAYDDYALGGAERAHGNKFSVSAKLEQHWFVLMNAVYGFNSYGGNAYGDELKLRERISDKLALYEKGEITHYDKITSSARWAYSSQGGVEYSFSSPLKVTVGGEFNSNNILRYDARFVAKLTYSLWAEI